MAQTAEAAVFDGPLTICDADAVTALGDVLRSHGFAGAAVNRAFGAALPVGKFHFRDDLPVYLRRLAEPTPINTLVKLFVLDQWVERDAVRESLAPLTTADITRMGLVESGARGVHALVRLSGYNDLILVHDRFDEQAGTLGRDHVLDVNPTTVNLTNLTVRRAARTALDIGTGCGVAALLASRHSDQVIGTDTNPRALNMAVFNARLNGISNVEWRLGSLFEPVEGSRFDLISCNPPYVISPETKFIFRDGGRRGDALSEEIVRRAPAYLEEGGFATFLVNWCLAPDEEWSAPPRRWVDGNGCDTWILKRGVEEPLTYAALWNRSRDRVAYGEALDRWMTYFRELRIAAIGMGAVILRHRTGARNWVRADDVPEGELTAASDQIQRVFASQDFLASLRGHEQLFSHSFKTAEDHRLVQVLSFQDGEYSMADVEVRLHGGLAFHGEVDPYTIRLLARCDGRHTLEEIAAELAEKGELGRDQVRRACAAIATRLISLGFLTPAE